MNKSKNVKRGKKTKKKLNEGAKSNISPERLPLVLLFPISERDRGEAESKEKVRIEWINWDKRTDELIFLFGEGMEETMLS